MGRALSFTILLQIFMAFIFNNNLEAKANTAKYPEMGLYGFYLGQTVEEACENAINRKYAITVSSPIKMHNIPDNLKNQLLKFKEEQTPGASALHFEQVGVPKNCVDFDILKYTVEYPDFKDIEKIFGNVFDDLNSPEKKTILKYLQGNIEIEVPAQFKLKMLYIIENFDTLKAKIYLISFTEINSALAGKMIEEMTGRYGKTKDYTMSSRTEAIVYTIDSLVWSNNETIAVFSTKYIPYKPYAYCLKFYSPRLRHQACAYYKNIIDKKLNH